MFEKQPTKKLAAVFAAVAGLSLVLYEFTPRRVDVNVVSMDRVFAGENETERYLITDQQQPATMKDPSQFAFPANGIYPQPIKANCVRSRSFSGGPAFLHDCEPR